MHQLIDLFEERARQARASGADQVARIWDVAAICPACGAAERTAWSLAAGDCTSTRTPRIIVAQGVLDAVCRNCAVPWPVLASLARAA